MLYSLNQYSGSCFDNLTLIVYLLEVWTKGESNHLNKVQSPHRFQGRNTETSDTDCWHWHHKTQTWSRNFRWLSQWENGCGKTNEPVFIKKCKPIKIYNFPVINYNFTIKYPHWQPYKKSESWIDPEKNGYKSNLKYLFLLPFTFYSSRKWKFHNQIIS